MNRITYKDIIQACSVSKTTAHKILKEMKLHYNPKSGILTFAHLSDYFSVG
jgi:hypothetical protein